MARDRSYTDEQLGYAVAHSRSWRGTLLALGLVATSGSAMRSVRAHADRLGLGYDHFSIPRGFSDDRLRAAVAAAADWDDVAKELCLEDASALVTARGHAARLGLDTDHLSRTPIAVRPNPKPDLSNLARAGSLLAAGWCTMCGWEVSWPLEPCRYDLVVSGAKEFRRVQVKTTTTRANGSWKVYLSTAHGGRRTYSTDEIDEFFIIDGELDYYVIPVADVGGLHAVHLSAYADYRLSTRT
ncbi:group I intron-associated PD-(D/E)XK endonuclease [Microbacterium sp. NPDC056057]|uniref:group I intron-associated PD-(D/E)XK endonuclease n=1 Tax=Microbacterium sp. NPDC056057 TaxID=3345699 RepID=UPI0035D89DCA